MGKDLRGE